MGNRPPDCKEVRKTEMNLPTKEQIRRARKAMAEKLPAAYYRKADLAIREKVLALPAWREAKTVMAYVSVAGEPDTRALIDLAAVEGKRVLLPRCPDRIRMEAVPFSGWERMRRSPFGIPEPEGEAAEEKPELILIPCVAATAEGTRLGHGAGYYDRFLRTQDGLKVCLCFGAFLTERLPSDPWDLKMDLVLTEGDGQTEAGERMQAERPEGI